MIAFHVKAQNGFPIDDNPTYSSPIQNRALDKSLPSVTLAGEVNIANGTANYSLPINVPAGVQGMQANLAVVYNSQAGNGQLGLGWGLAGLSAISRGGSAHFLDGAPAPVTLSADDNLYLDGQRLLEYYNSSNNSAEYRTLTESYQKIEMIDGDIFMVTQKDGTKRYYGGVPGVHSDGRVILMNTASQNAVTHTWLLCKVQDRNGNYIIYEYAINANTHEARINKIQYTGNGNVAPKTEVQFRYMSRTDARVGYLAGNAMHNSLLLKSITVMHNNQQHGKYTLNYMFDQTPKLGNDFSKLIEIEYQAQTEELNSVVVNWNAPSIEYNLQQSYYISNVHGSNGKRIYGDFNADGYDDYISLIHRVIDDGKCDIGFDGKPPLSIQNHEWEVHIGLNNRNGSFVTNPIIGTFVSNWKPGECIRTAFAGIYSGDFNGDGLIDFIIQKVSINGSENHYSVDVYLNNALNPGTFDFLKTIIINRDWDGSTPVYFTSSNKPFSLIIADIDGDGKSDIVHQATDILVHGQMIMAYFDLDLPAMHQSFYYQTPPGGLDSALVGDFNGDGKADFVLPTNSGTDVITFLNRVDFEILFSSFVIRTNDYFRVADFNGDGLSDFIVWKNPNTTHYNAGKWLIYFSNGVGLSGPKLIGLDNTQLNLFYRNNKPAFHTNAPYVFYSDLDGDGRSDIVFYKKQGTTEELHVFYNKINMFEKTIIPLPLNSVNPVGMQYGNEFEFTFVDFTGDGKPELFYNVRIYNTNTYYNIFCEFRPQDKSIKISQILDGANRLTKFTYKPISDNYLYSKGTTGEYPNPIIYSPLQVISEVQQELFDGTLVNHYKYQYQSLRVNSVGLGLLGFEKIVENNLIQLLKKESYFKVPIQPQQNTLPMVPEKIKLLSTDQNSPNTFSMLSETEFEFGANIAQQFPHVSHPQFIPKVIEEKSNDLILETSAITNYAYDGFGNVTSSTTKTFNNINHQNPYVSQTQESVNFAHDYGSWMTWLPSSTTTTITRQGQPPAIKIVNYAYNTVNGNPITITSYPNTEAQVIAQFQYDNFGNQTQELVTPVNMTPRTSSYTYTPDGRFVETETNPKNWTVEYEYDDLKGVRKKQTDFNGLITEWEHDEFGRVTKEIAPDGSEVVTQYNYFQGTSNLLLFQNTITGTAMPQSDEFLDGAGRVRQQRVRNIKNEWSVTRADYDSRGRKYRTSQPYISSSGSPPVIHWNVTTFDGINRPLTVTSAAGTSLSFTYSGRTTTQTNSQTGQSSSSTVDADGLTSTATDAGGTITYLYNSFGKPISITGPSGTPITSTYDAFGRQTQLNDPAAGPVTYEYNALNELIQQVDNEGNTYNMAYDILGRLTTNTGPEGTYTNTYDNSFIGKIDTRSAPNGSTSTSHYNTLGRLEVYEEVVNSKTFTIHNQYNAIGQLISKTYPSGFTVDYAYNTNGYLTQMNRADDSRNIWQFVDENNLGAPTEFMLGDNTQWTMTYQPISGLPTGVDNNKNWGMTYSFDLHTGNLESRGQSYLGLTESFDYDALDRLTAYNSLSNPITVNYANTGSITFKGDAGTYSNDMPTGRTTQISHASGQSAFAISEVPQNITYTSFNSVETIHEGAFEAFFTYGPDQQRTHMLINENGSPYIERYYIAGGQYERDRLPNGQWRNLTYIPTPSGQMALYIQNETTNEAELFFLHTDYQGSIMAIANFEGEIIEEYSYDPWGNRRNPENWQNIYTNTDLPTFKDSEATSLWGVGGILYRGYTFHEHLDCFALINMNGRMYDPVTGRMLSPDNFVHSSTQGLNRYSYVFNNPLKYTDPSGEIPVLLGTMLFSGLIQGAISHSNGQSFAYGFLLGAVSSAATFGLNQLFPLPGGILSGGVMGSVTGALSGGLSSAILSTGNSNTTFNDAFWSGAKQGWLGGAISGGTMGYKRAKAENKNLWWGNKIYHGRHKWSFYTMEKPYYERHLPIRSTQQNDRNTCLLTIATDYQDYYYGISLTQKDLKLAYEGTYHKIEDNLFPDVAIALDLVGLKKDIYFVSYNIDFIKSALDEGNPLILIYNTDLGPHAVGIKGIRLYHDNPPRIYFSNPGVGGTSVNIGTTWKDFQSLFKVTLK